MIIGTCKVYLTADWVYSLKDKRTVTKSLIEKIRHKFNVSVAEIEHQDIHKSIVIGFACVTNETSHANSVIDTVINYIENHTDAELGDVVIEIL
ncbi:MAG: DUF503 domain-containing protein [Clostridiales bacterium]|nr:DUF503 domain-containing protein [Clostridiales bacterium]